MSDLFSAVKSSFEKMGWAYRPVEAREVIEADFEAYHTKVSLHVQVFAELHVVSVVSESALTSGDQVILRAVAELLMRANTELTLGAFELEWDKPRLLFRVSNVFPVKCYDENIIASLVHTTVVETDRITPFVAVVEKTRAEEAGGLDLEALLGREDLLPVVEGSGDDRVS
jgi:hypothetical protein